MNNKEKAKEQIENNKRIIGNNIKNARLNFQKENNLDKPLTQEQLADMIGVSKNTISLLEKGTSTPSLTRILEICQVLNICIFDIFKDTSVLQTPMPKGLSNKFEALNNKEKTAVLDFINFLIVLNRNSDAFDVNKYSDEEKQINMFIKFLLKKELDAIKYKENKDREESLRKYDYRTYN